MRKIITIGQLSFRLAGGILVIATPCEQYIFTGEQVEQVRAFLNEGSSPAPVIVEDARRLLHEKEEQHE